MLEVSLLPFIATSLLIILTPGQDMVLVMSRSLSSGTRVGITTAAGISSGLLLHTILAMLGVGTLLQASEWLFFILKLIGAIYLIYLGFKLFRSTDDLILVNNHRAPDSSFKIFLQGAFSNISNPKIMLFYFAFLPQFIHPNSTNPMLSLFILGATFAGLTFLVKGPIALVSGVLANKIQKNPYFLTYMYKVSGTVLFILGIKLALEDK